MVPFRISILVLALASSAFICAPIRGQGDPGNQYKVKQVKEAPRPMPFPPDGESPTPGRVYAIEFRSLEQMTEKDRNVEADGEQSIRERAGFQGLEFNEGTWTYQQLVCPALPNHVFLKFTRNAGAGDVSLFTASIPRGGDGRVRIIPVLRRGYSLFSPAPINALTISAFNHIRAEEHPAGPPDWLTTGLCYAALAGAHPQAAPQTDSGKGGDFPAAMSGVLQIPNRGGAIIRFVDVAAPRRPMQWTMIFDSKGKLLKATHVPASLVTVKAALPPASDPVGKQVP